VVDSARQLGASERLRQFPVQCRRPFTSAYRQRRTLCVTFQRRKMRARIRSVATDVTAHHRGQRSGHAGRAPDSLQPRHPLDARGQGLVGAAFALSCAFHTDLGLQAQFGRALLRAADHTADQARRSSQHPRTRRCHPLVREHLQRRFKAARLDHLDEILGRLARFCGRISDLGQ
jgi:hypothetical protein